MTTKKGPDGARSGKAFGDHMRAIPKAGSGGTGNERKWLDEMIKADKPKSGEKKWADEMVRANEKKWADEMVKSQEKTWRDEI